MVKTLFREVICVSYLSADIFNVDFAGTNLQSLFSDGIKVFFLANVSGKADNLVSFFL